MTSDLMQAGIFVSASDFVDREVDSRCSRIPTVHGLAIDVVVTFIVGDVKLKVVLWEVNPLDEALGVDEVAEFSEIVWEGWFGGEAGGEAAEHVLAWLFGFGTGLLMKYEVRSARSPCFLCVL